MTWWSPILCSTELGQISVLRKENTDLKTELTTEQLDHDKKIKDLNDALYKSKMDLTYAQTQVADSKTVIDQLNAQVPEPLELWEIAWETKFKKVTVKWDCRPHVKVVNGNWIVDSTMAVNVMAFWQPKTIEETATMIRSLNIAAYNTKDWDTLAWKVEEYVKKKIHYVSEQPKEFWKFPFETEKDGFGDCDDGAIYICNLLLAVGIPPDRIKGCVGSVLGGDHYYTSYCRTTDNKHVILDWCYEVTTAKIADRPLHSQKYDYYQVNFSVTPKATWAKPDFGVV